jgi:glyoxylase-like metal-dependent hydrolase (beta-lactamase superfamily II)
VSEPGTVAETVEEVVAGVWSWTVHDERIDFRSDAYAVATAEGVLLIDPLPLADDRLASLGQAAAICLTGAHHQRSAWRFRRALGVPVHAPEGGRRMEEEPDAVYGAGARLPGGLRAIHAPGPTDAHYALLLERPGGDGVLFIADLLLRYGDGPLTFVPDRHLDDPALARETVRGLLELPIATLCPAHGAPAVGDARAAMAEALGLDAG